MFLLQYILIFVATQLICLKHNIIDTAIGF